MVRETFPKRVTVEESFGRDLWPIKGNPTQFHQILMNLCVNARDAMTTGGTLTLTAENVALDEKFCIDVPEARPGEFLKLCVIDTGTGITPENLKKMWRPFFTTKPIGKGTGLGLPTVKRLLEEEHNGFLRLLTEVGKGTRFELYFPSAASIGNAQGVEYHRGNGERVLVLEPGTAARAAVEMGLERIGYIPVSARNAEEAGERIRSQRFSPKLAIVDPSVKGSIALIKTALPGVPIIAHMANSGSQANLEEIEAEIIRLTKPASDVQLASALYRALLKHKPNTAPT
jgi:CheY-like chemotaxis protein